MVKYIVAVTLQFFMQYCVYSLAEHFVIISIDVRSKLQDAYIHKRESIVVRYIIIITGY